jgi:acetyltransferase-like isoleucine patch superfamily enzyme
VKRDPVKYARSLGVKIGSDVRLISITPDSRTFGSEPYLLSIGDHVTVTGGVRFVTHDDGVWVFRQEVPDIDVFGPIEIGDNVFLGRGAIILPSVKIGATCVVTAGSVVTKNIPSNCIDAGVPAKVSETTREYHESLEDRKVFLCSLAGDNKRALKDNKAFARRGFITAL